MNAPGPLFTPRSLQVEFCMMPRTYRVIYEIDVECETPEEAASEAFETMMAGGLPVLQVIEWLDKTTAPITVDPTLGQTIDLEKLEPQDPK
jgi:hypothetical protein